MGTMGSSKDDKIKLVNMSPTRDSETPLGINKNDSLNETINQSQ